MACWWLQGATSVVRMLCPLWSWRVSCRVACGCCRSQWCVCALEPACWCAGCRCRVLPQGAVRVMRALWSWPAGALRVMCALWSWRCWCRCRRRVLLRAGVGVWRALWSLDAGAVPGRCCCGTWALVPLQGVAARSPWQLEITFTPCQKGKCLVAA